LIPERDRELVGLRMKIFNFHRIAGTIAGPLDSVEPELEEAGMAFAPILGTSRDDDALTKMAKQEILPMQPIEEKCKK
jgi:hypothetical protein